MNLKKRKSRVSRYRQRVWLVLSGVGSLVLLLLSSCFEIVQVNQPNSAQVGEEITVTIQAEVTGKDGSLLIFGFCAPRAWQAYAHTTVSFESSIGSSTMSLIDPEEVDAENKKPWAEQIADRVGFGGNYGEMEWLVFKADGEFTPPDGTSMDSPVTGTITLKTRVGASNLITQLGYFLGEGTWGYLNDDSNSTFFFEETCLEVTGASGQAQDLCGPPPRQLVSLATYTFNDLITIIFDAQEDQTALVGAEQVFMCSEAIYAGGTARICEQSQKTEMKLVGPDIWQLTIWPPKFYAVADGHMISELLVNFQDANGGTIVRNVSGNDFQILTKCFQ